MLGLSSIFLFNLFLHVFCNSTKTSANSSVIDNERYHLVGRLSINRELCRLMHCNVERSPVHCSLKAAWVDYPPTTLPEPLDHCGKGLYQGALHGRVACVDLSQVFVVQQVVRQMLGVAQALKICVLFTVES